MRIEERMMKRKNIIFDLDGTVFDCTHRLHYIEGEKKDWDSFHNSCLNDAPIRPIIALLQKMYMAGYPIVFCTGRPESSRKYTELSISKHIGLTPKAYQLLMRPTGDYRPDTVVKPEALRKADITTDDVWFIVEDRAKVVRKWRELGFTVLQCAEGDY
jgi:hypothetical protein